MGVKGMKIRQKISWFIGKILYKIIYTPVDVLYKVKQKVINFRVSRASEEKAICITVNAIIRDLVKYDDEKIIVIADYVDSESFLTFFGYGGNIGTFKNSYEGKVYRKLIRDNVANQYKVIYRLKETRGITVLERAESDFRSYYFREFKNCYEIQLTTE